MRLLSRLKNEEVLRNSTQGGLAFHVEPHSGGLRQRLIAFTATGVNFVAIGLQPYFFFIGSTKLGGLKVFGIPCFFGGIGKMQKLIWLLVAVLIIVHQDFWFWEDSTLVFGFMPIGLFYHACLSLAAGFVWFLACTFAWPKELVEMDAANSKIASKGGQV